MSRLLKKIGKNKIMLNFEYKLFSRLNNLAGHHPILDMVMVITAKYGVLIYAGCLAYLWFKPGTKLDNRKLVLRAVISALIALGINQVIGFFYFRPRPFAEHQVNLLLDKSPDPSFPSDHATGSSALTLSVIGSNKLLGLIMTAATVILMLSRVYVGLHYSFDIFGGAVTGLAGSLISGLLWPRLDKVAAAAISVYDKFIPV